MPKGKKQIAKGYVYKLDIDNCRNLQLFYQNVEAAQENEIHLEDANDKLNYTS